MRKWIEGFFIALFILVAIFFCGELEVYSQYGQWTVPPDNYYCRHQVCITPYPTPTQTIEYYSR